MFSIIHSQANQTIDISPMTTVSMMLALMSDNRINAQLNASIRLMAKRVFVACRAVISLTVWASQKQFATVRND